MESIFIQIGSYHDYELLPTLENMVKGSSGNNMLHFGIHNGYYEDNLYKDQLIEKTLAKYDKPFKISIVHSKFPENVGVNMSRYIANELYAGEDYYLQIDSHMRFIHYWDSHLIQEVKEAISNGIKKPVLSAFPSRYFLDQVENLEKNLEKNGNDVSHYKTSPRTMDGVGEMASLLGGCFEIPMEDLMKYNHIFNEIFLTGNFIFSLGSFSKIKPNKHIMFLGDESLISLRAYTHGFTYVSPKLRYHFHFNRVSNNWRDIEKNRRRSAEHDLLDYYGNSNIWEDIKMKTFHIIRKMIAFNIIGDQEFGVERDVSSFMKKIQPL